MVSHLVIPDAHAHPSHHNERFTWLGRLVADLKPTKVIMLGDWADMPSLCSYDKGTKGYEGRRYMLDINSAIDAQERFFEPIRAAKKRLPEFIMLEGNHEFRIKRAIDTDAALLDGVISTDDLEYQTFGWDYVEYNGSTPDVRVIDGIAYAHFFTSGVMNRPIGGQNPAYQILSKQYMSGTQGHTHTTDYCVRTAANGQMVHGLVAGVYQDYDPSFAGEANKLWWRGVVFKSDVHNGMYDPRWISLDAIRREYA